MTTLPADPQELNRLYNKTVDHHKQYLDKVHQAFDRRCEEIKLATHEKLNGLPESDQQGRQQTLDEEKAELDKVLSELKMTLQKSSQDARQKLEEIEARLDTHEFDFETQLTTI